MNAINFEDTFTNEIQVVYNDDTCSVVMEYENDHIPADDLFDVVNRYQNDPHVAGIRIIRTTNKYNVVDIPFEAED